MASNWKLLKYENTSEASIPPLLVKHEFGPSRYKRAWEIETDIDPLESDQRQTLLQKIEDCLNEVPGTKLALSRSSDIGEILQDKDHVISKFTDKLQSEGLELEQVFPSAILSKSSRKAVSEEDIGKTVKGLAPFDEKLWRRQFTEDGDVPGTHQGLLSQLFAKSKGFSSSNVGEQLTYEDWWERLSDETPLADNGEAKASQSQSQSSTANDFQRQTTPDGLVRPSLGGRTSSAQMTLPQRGINAQAKARESADDGSTTGASDDDLEPVHLKPRARRQSLIIKSQEGSSSQSSSPEPARDTKIYPSPKVKGVLGRIGGPSKPSLSPSKPKLGQIGDTTKLTQRPIPTSRSPEPRGRPPKQPESPPSPRETSRERADRKREQLKRELEEKSKLGAKKKRKF
ncbi:MAG: hypothetical protein Q9207_001188 [Kuettlingeria erythrocarpa]